MRKHPEIGFPRMDWGIFFFFFVDFHIWECISWNSWAFNSMQTKCTVVYRFAFGICCCKSFISELNGGENRLRPIHFSAYVQPQEGFRGFLFAVSALGSVWLSVSRVLLTLEINHLILPVPVMFCFCSGLVPSNWRQQGLPKAMKTSAMNSANSIQWLASLKIMCLRWRSFASMEGLLLFLVFVTLTICSIL